MSGLQNYVRGNRNGQAGSPQDGQPVNRNRQAFAANLRVQMKPHIARPPTTKELDARGESIAQQQSVPAPQQHSLRRLSGESRRHSPWDTDAESIDTTIDQSAAQTENSQQHEHHLLQSNTEESEVGGDEASDPDELEDEVAEYGEDVTKYLAAHNLADAPQEEQLNFLQETQPHLFPTVDGDSYPTTTDGHPTEWDEQQELRYEDLGSPSLSPEHVPQHLNATRSNQQPLQNPASNLPHSNSPVPHSSKFWQQGAQIREQIRNDNAVQAHANSGRKHDTARPPASQSLSHNQNTDERQLLASSATHSDVEGTVQDGQRAFTGRPNRAEPRHVHNPILQTKEPIARHIPTSRGHIVPVVQQLVEHAPVREAQVFLGGDYDPEVLDGIAYDSLRDESFDKNPRQRDPVLPKDMRERPLPERLRFAQHEFDPLKQSEFFSALPTSEWEEAGDWFLDQFSAIIKKTRETRQKKRKAAQELEREIDGRHLHITKKQRSIKDAMAKMQAQGEGLMPKSPRVSKSPGPTRD
ncbi:hypothetical protein SVAN01_04576 [Stagonosporopsis vannaccii]|nr:hypothetical protein SVAN01_04576 [Stagonosporopsis vannaccii]